MTFEDKVRVLEDLYRWFNRREIDRVLSALSTTVRWPNVIERTEIHGHEAVRAYWSKQFQTIEPLVEPVGFQDRDSSVAVRVHQVVRIKATGQVVESDVTHAFSFDQLLITSMVVS